MKIRALAALSFSLCILCSCNLNVPTKQNSYNEDFVGELLLKVNKDLKLLSLSNLDSELCSGYGELTNFISSDFNGDKNIDYAVLLTERLSDEVIEWNGKELREADILIMVFMGDGTGSYNSHTLEKVTGHLPSIFTIKQQSIGEVRERESSKIITLKQPAITRVHCEKSEVVYYWNNNGFKNIVKAD